MFSVTITGDTPEALKKNVQAYLGTTAAVSTAATSTASSKGAIKDTDKGEGALSASEQAKLRGDATISEPKSGKGAAKDKKDKKGTATPEPEPENEAPADDETGDGTEAQTYTQDEVKQWLLDAKAATNDPKTISEIVQSVGVTKLSDVKEEDYAKVVGAAKDRIAKAKKK